MAITLVGEDKTDIAIGTGTETVNFSFTPAENDIVVVLIGSDVDIPVGPVVTSGYSFIYDDTAEAAPGSCMLQKVMGASPDSSIELKQDGLRKRCVTLQCWRGVDPTNPIDFIALATTGSGINPNPGAGTSTVDGVLSIASFVLDDDDAAASTTGPSGYTNLIVEEAGGITRQSATCGMASDIIPTAGSRDPGTFDTGSSDAWRAYHCGLKPAPTVGFVPNDIVTGAPVLDQPTLSVSSSVAFDPNDIVTGAPVLDQPTLTIESPSRNGGRGMTTGQVSRLKEPRLKLAYFVEAEFESGTLRLWTGIHDSPPIRGHIWVGAGKLLGFKSFEESQNVKATGVNISLSGTDQSLISIAFNENYQGRPCRIYFGSFDENNQLIDDIFQIFSGQMDLMELEPVPNGSANFTLKVENRMVDLLVTRPSFYTDADQQARFPGDTFYKRVSQNGSRKIIWGRG